MNEEAWNYDIDNDEGLRDQFEEINQSMTYTIPQLGDNVLRHAKLVRVCKTRGCYQNVYVSEVCKNGAPVYHCPTHGKRNRSQMGWHDITGSTMLEFRKVGLNEKQQGGYIDL